mmetsp:Transcript_37818/g.65187  ORF Transcript_37818/g.65187 Transcript_37818/m.65187 type:complete len:159 (+) Transcript_37818:185-661(+)
MIGLAGPGRWPVFTLTLVLYNLVTSALCMLIGLVTTSNAVSNAAGSLMVLFSLLFAGYLQSPAKIPDGWKWMSHLSPSAHAYNALLTNELAGIEQLSITTVIGDDKETAGPFTGRTILSCFHLGDHSPGYYNTVLATGLCVLIAAIYLTQHVFLKERR